MRLCQKKGNFTPGLSILGLIYGNTRCSTVISWRGWQGWCWWWPLHNCEHIMIMRLLWDYAKRKVISPLGSAVLDWYLGTRGWTVASWRWWQWWCWLWWLHNCDNCEHIMIVRLCKKTILMFVKSYQKKGNVTPGLSTLGLISGNTTGWTVTSWRWWQRVCRLWSSQDCDNCDPIMLGDYAKRKVISPLGSALWDWYLEHNRFDRNIMKVNDVTLLLKGHLGPPWVMSHFCWKVIWATWIRFPPSWAPQVRSKTWDFYNSRTSHRPTIHSRPAGQRPARA